MPHGPTLVGKQACSEGVCENAKVKTEGEKNNYHLRL